MIVVITHFGCSLPAARALNFCFGSFLFHFWIELQLFNAISNQTELLLSFPKVIFIEFFSKSANSKLFFKFVNLRILKGVFFFRLPSFRCEKTNKLVLSMHSYKVF